MLIALKRLAQKRPAGFFFRRGVPGRRFTMRDMACLFAVREFREGLAARLATGRIDSVEVERLALSFRGFEGKSSEAESGGLRSR